MPEESFTLDVLRWRPWIPPVELAQADEAQGEALAAAGAVTRDSPYFRTLAHAPEALLARTTLYRDVVYGRGGLSRPEREFAALVVSRTNGCRYCASIHGRRFVELTGDRPSAQLVLDGADPAALPPRLSAIGRFAQKLASHPSDLARDDADALRARGFNDPEILDLLQVAAMFQWANTLMLTLGQPEPIPGEL